MRNSSGTGMSIFVVIAGLVIEALFFYLFDIEVDSVPVFFIILLWFVNSGVLAYIYWRFFGDGKNRKNQS